MSYEQMGSREITYTKTGVTGTRIFVHPWDESGRYVQATCPLGSSFPGVWYLKVVSINFKPYGQSKDGTQGDEYTHAYITVEYATTPYSDDGIQPRDSDGDRASRSIEMAVTTLDIGKNRYWSDGVSLVNIQQNVEFYTLEEQIDISTGMYPTTTVMGLLNKVNSTSWRGYPAGTCLFTGASSQQEWDGQNNNYKARVSLKFSIRPSGWNWSWNDEKVGGAGWDYTIPLLYTEADLSPLESI